MMWRKRQVKSHGFDFRCSNEPINASREEEVAVRVTIRLSGSACRSIRVASDRAPAMVSPG